MKNQPSQDKVIGISMEEIYFTLEYLNLEDRRWDNYFPIIEKPYRWRHRYISTKNFLQAMIDRTIPSTYSMIAYGFELFPSREEKVPFTHLHTIVDRWCMRTEYLTRNKWVPERVAKSGEIETIDITHGYDAVELKNLYHSMMAHGFDRETIDSHSILGHAYVQALGGDDRLPSAEAIFETLKKILTRMEYAGWDIEEEVKKQFMA